MLQLRNSKEPSDKVNQRTLMVVVSALDAKNMVMGLFQNVLTGLVLYTLSLVIALLPIGEWILRVQNGCKPLTQKEQLDRIMPLFNEVYIKARKIDPTISKDVKLFISNDPSPNAFATGHKTICLTSGLLQYNIAMNKLKQH